MAIVVLVLWLFTAGAGFYLLVTSNLRGARPAAALPVAQPAPDAEPATASVAAPAAQAPAAQAPAAQAPAAKRPSRAARDRFAPPSLVAARNAPVLPGLRSLLEFAHPACAIIGLGFWLGYTFVHYRALGWIAFGLVTVTVCLGLSWFAANTRAARRTLSSEHRDVPVPSFSTRLIALHGGAAAVTFVLAALTALVLGR
jgi:hypothetical protein